MLHCDGVSHCEDGSDERACNYTGCSHSAFTFSFHAFLRGTGWRRRRLISNSTLRGDRSSGQIRHPELTGKVIRISRGFREPKEVIERSCHNASEDTEGCKYSETSLSYCRSVSVILSMLNGIFVGAYVIISTPLPFRNRTPPGVPPPIK